MAWAIRKEGDRVGVGPANWTHFHNLSLNNFNDSVSYYMSNFLYLVKNYVYKACNPTVLNISGS